MADFKNRDEWEQKLATALARLGSRQRERVIAALGDPPDLNNLSPEFWNETTTEMRGEIYTVLEKIFLESANNMLVDFPSIGVDWTLINERAAQWARQYTYDLVRGINQNTRAALQQKVASYFEDGLTIGDLRETIAPLFGSVRAEIIATTEVTRAAVNGELEIARGLREQGIQMIEVWNTRKDEIVCPICAPRNGKRRGDGWDVPPPGHPRCRCWLAHEFKED